MHNPYLTQAHKLVSSTQVKRSLTPRRRAREYALQGIYQWLVVRSSGSVPNQSSIERQLAEDPGFKKAQDEFMYIIKRNKKIGYTLFLFYALFGRCRVCAACGIHLI